MLRVYIFEEKNGAGLGWRGNQEPIVKSVYGELKLEHGRQTTIDVIFNDASWRFAGRHPPERWDQRCFIGHIHLPDAAEPLTVCSEIRLSKGDQFWLWVMDPANQPLVEISGGRVPRFSKECGASRYVSARSAVGHELWVTRPGFRESLRDFFLPGRPYAYTHGESIFSDRPLIAGVLLFEKLVDPLADSSS